MTAVPFALVGTGAIAQSYAAAFENNPLARLVAVADTRPDAAKAFADRFACPWFTSHEALLGASTGVEAVIVCTPPNTHEELTLAFAARGVHVLCEKPFALDSASARRMVKAAAAAGVKLTMGSKFRYVDDMVKAKSIVASGILGEVILFENAFTSRVDMGGRWNAVPGVSGGGVLIDNGTHSVDILRYFLGPLAEVHAVEGKRVQGLGVEDTARLFVRAACGVMGSVDLSWSLNKELDWYANVYGSHGTVQVGWKRSRYRQQGSQDWVQFGNGYDKVQAFRSQVNNVAAAVRGREPLLITAEDALASVEVIEAAYRSMRAAPWTGVAGSHTPPPVSMASAIREVARV